MLNSFYITATKETSSRTWYQVLLKDTHFCMSCGTDLDSLLEGLKTIVKTYRTRQRLDRALMSMTYPAKVSEPTFRQRSAYYAEHGEDYEDLVHSTVLQALEEAREEDKRNSPYNKTKRKIKKVFSPVKSLPQEDLQRTPKGSPARTCVVSKKPKLFKRR